jgi:hypothetical protein
MVLMTTQATASSRRVPMPVAHPALLALPPTVGSLHSKPRSLPFLEEGPSYPQPMSFPSSVKRSHSASGC